MADLTDADEWMDVEALAKEYMPSREPGDLDLSFERVGELKTKIGYLDERLGSGKLRKSK